MTIEPLQRDPQIIQALAQLLVDTVAARGSIGFMHPVNMDTAKAFWKSAMDAAGRDERVILGAFEDKILLGTVTLILNCPPNQPHRAEIAKMMTRLDRRGQGVGKALVQAAEEIAAARGRTLINLDTAEEEGAAGFYESLGYQKVGVIPDYALKPYGGLTGTVIYWKRL
jgi:ribosomal protein S18 acetylase RimI-like enzyme